MIIRARDIMQTDVVTASPQMSLVELTDTLISERISGVPVVEDGRVVGHVSRSDLVRVASLEHSLAEVAAQVVEVEEFAPDAVAPPPAPSKRLLSQLEGRTVRDIMVVDPVMVAPDTPITGVAQLMVNRHLHRLLVGEGGSLRGVISSLDLVRLIAQERLRPV
jgi:CBS domain-containing protein